VVLVIVSNSNVATVKLDEWKIANVDWKSEREGRRTGWDARKEWQGLAFGGHVGDDLSQVICHCQCLGAQHVVRVSR
jgi:hypothetical protein